MAQYQKEERALIATRLTSSPKEITDILNSMEKDVLSKDSNIESLKNELARHYNNPAFLRCKNMGAILRMSLNQLIHK